MLCEHDVEIFFDNVIGKDFRVSLSACKSIPNDDEIVMGQIPLEQQGYKGEGT